MSSFTRRAALKTVAVGGSAVVAPSFATVVQGATSSGNIEIKTTSTIPSPSSIGITVYEDLDGNGTTDNQQLETIPDGTDQITQYDGLEGTESSGHKYWMDIDLSTDDHSKTPELDTMTITLPEETSGTGAGSAKEPQGLAALWDNFLAFVTITVMTAGALGGMGSRSMAIGSFGAYLVFVHIAVKTGEQLLLNILYVSLVLVILGMAFKLWRLELGGEA